MNEAPKITVLVDALPVTLGSYAPIVRDIETALQSPQCSLGTVAAAIEKDPDLTARLLRLANSGFYGFPNRLATVSEALSLIGIQQVQDLIVSTSIIDRFSGVGTNFVNMRDFWRHSLACGVGARSLATTRHMRGPDKFFVAGLLHDVGRLALFSKVPELSQRIFGQHREQGGLLRQAERDVLGYDHADIGGALMKRWQLPPRLVEAVENHHRPTACQVGKEEAAVVHLVDHLVNALQLGTSGEPLTPPLQAAAWDLLQLELGILDSLAATIDTQLEAVEDAFLRAAPGPGHGTGAGHGHGHVP